MKKIFFLQLLVITASLYSLSGCQLVKGIFNFGFGLGIFVTLLVIGLIIWGITKIFK